MNERLNYDKLTTADIANPSRADTANAAGTDTPDLRDGGTGPDSTSFDSPSLDVRTGRPTVVDMRSGQAAAVSDSKLQNSGNANTGQPNPLFVDDELYGFRSRWDEVQTSFVDEPRAAVEQADSLVASVVKRIAEQFAAEREQLEKQWDRGENVNTEDLRQAFKRYRAFFDRLLSV
jgi:hypothetical protein